MPQPERAGPPLRTEFVHKLAMHTIELSLDKRIQYVHDYLKAKVWYAAQIFPLLDDCITILNTSISWFLWKGDYSACPCQSPKDETLRKAGT
jgi:hypothetical protein